MAHSFYIITVKLLSSEVIVIAVIRSNAIKFTRVAALPKEIVIREL